MKADYTDYIESRALEAASYIIGKKATIRCTAEKFGVSRSTVHRDVTERLFKINPGIASEVKSVLDFNKRERHIRGGEATRMLYSNN
ncbi:sporulation transcriptional regulator SpoIIID [Clostridium argentinense CDC 2741]|uniref:Sporulation transcriptional regulator SpoIIID n=1 Tax=Clostridium argentinense CDC 2741 TaxID=1418104 RepID=A0A0C1R8K5_9CLOT|nr:sporulation transcriptional regulator SpoIIID [Clostridium argentinense]ARC85658.1 sporulation transcriptional regulator SpoIIID [Clostridium argentinense]KIE46866.1 sporulation transcriptional regulator SpoIIID [Clostridium argentinense CDC 2741]